MFRIFRLIAFSLFSLTFSLTSFANDSLALRDIKVSSKKISEGRYEFHFTAGIQGDWQVYAPNQLLLGIKTTELKFLDSSIVQTGNFTLAAAPKEINSTIFEGTKVGIYEKSIDWSATVEFKNNVPSLLKGVLAYTFGKEGNNEFYPSTEIAFSVELEGGKATTVQIKYDSINLDKSVMNCGDEVTKGKSLLSIFLLGLLGGFIALLTPCVFPMIPVTVTFFTKRSGQKNKGIFNAVIYGLCIFLIYTLITVPFHFAGAKSEVFNNLSTNVWLNLVFFAIFIIFAFSFFGFYELTLPSSIANKADSKSGIGNIAGIFFMAATLAIVSFSCTGPILGTLLVGVSDQGAWPLTVGAAGFGLALSLPFALFAMFPNWLQSLPRSGSWMITVKKVLGFVELALAVKFLANADNVKQWGIIKREVFVGLWVIIGVCTTIYLLKPFVKKPVGPKPGLIRLMFGLLFAAFTIYLVPGLTNTKYANLRLLSGFPPPLSYSIYPDHVLHAKGVKPIVNDLDAALTKAKLENKPVLIDFTGWACVNCRRMEEKVWTNHDVDSLMRTKFIVVSLYVDEHTKLPVSDQFTYTAKDSSEVDVVTVGDKWTLFQKENFGAVAQPQYAIVSPNLVALTKSKFYTPNAGDFIKWLQCGLEGYDKLNQSVK